MTTPWVLETRGLSRSFAGFVAVDRVDLKVARGQVHALIGPNGAGKTTCFNLLTRFIAPTAGQILFEGRDITREPAARVAGQGLVRSFQISAVFPTLSLLENVRLALQRKLGTHYHFWRTSRSLCRLDERALLLLSEVGLLELAHTPAAQLPYGRKRALEIATTLAMDPLVMLLDEPTQGIGHEEVERVMQLIRRAATGRTVLMVEHNMKVVSGVSDTITVLARGQVLAQGSYAEIARDPRVIEAYMGRRHG